MMHDFHTLFFQSSKKTKRKQKVPVYNLSSYFLHFFFFLQMDKMLFD